jgi:hypothetical protein
VTSTTSREAASSSAPAVLRATDELNGVAELFRMVIEEKLEEGPYKCRQFARMRLNVLVHVVDVGQSASMDFQRGGAGSVTVRSGGDLGKADLKIDCDNETVTQFAMFTLLPGGMPNFFDANGRSVVVKLLARKLIIRGLIRHLWGLVLFIRLFSIPDEA